eukprot:TRINITY_DN19631_c0_g4_i1.p1 TRINITY_DN19631_c0_g4~~TRINITY_DN19631_c0_g4_i1.p1  ORF type:complete len:341 (-),score=45.33 TRINITY_DN19631_c0_g4_i1:86-1108(-)
MIASQAASLPSFKGTDECSLDDLIGHLESTHSLVKAIEADPRPQIGPRIPLTEHRWKPAWKPPPDKRNIKKQPGDVVQPPWVRFVRNAGEDFHPRDKMPYLRAQIIDGRTAQRVNMPERTYSHLPSQIRYHAQSEPIPEPTDDMCHEIHRKWLQKHYKERDRHIYEVYHSLNRVDKAKQEVEEHQRRKEMAREMLGRVHDRSKMSEACKRGIDKVKRAIASTRAFRMVAKDSAIKKGDKEKALQFDYTQQEDNKKLAKLERARSHPCLRIRPPSPKGEVAHIRAWGNANVSLRSFKESTPWRENDMTRELQNLGRMTRGGQFKQPPTLEQTLKLRATNQW